MRNYRNTECYLKIFELKILLFDLSYDIVNNLVLITILQDTLAYGAEVAILEELSANECIELTPVRLSVDLEINSFRRKSHDHQDATPANSLFSKVFGEV